LALIELIYRIISLRASYITIAEEKN
jgi:hypothetical protein